MRQRQLFGRGLRRSETCGEQQQRVDKEVIRRPQILLLDERSFFPPLCYSHISRSFNNLTKPSARLCCVCEAEPLVDRCLWRTTTSWTWITVMTWTHKKTPSPKTEAGAASVNIHIWAAGSHEVQLKQRVHTHMARSNLGASAFRSAESFGDVVV